MNRRLKTEEPTIGSLKPAKRTRAAPRKSVTKKTSKRRMPSNNAIKENSSDEEFELKRSSFCNNLAPRKRAQKQKSAVANTSLKTTSSRCATVGNIYEISDSDTDDNLQIAGYTHAATEPINLCEMEDNTIENQASILDDIICNSKKNGKVTTNNKSDENVKNNGNYVYPSTSRTQSNLKNQSDVPNFINNLLCSNEDLLDENYLKSFKELNEQTDKLLASSWDLINNDNNRSFEDFVIYVCTEKELSSKTSQENNVQAAAVDLSKVVDEEQKMKTQCPICLEKLGSEPVSSTICGHIFCTACINHCIKSQKKCPTCRKRLTPKMIHPLFLF